jgi:hypothetical protein
MAAGLEERRHNVMFRILALMKFAENDVDLLNCINCCQCKNSTVWQELGQASNEPLNDFTTVFCQGYFGFRAST